MTKNIDRMHAKSGRVFEEDDTLTNVLDLLRGTTGGGPDSYMSSRITDRQGRSAKVSQKGELITGQCIDEVDINFQYTIRPSETFREETGTGSISHPGVSGSYAQLSPGTGIGRAALFSKKPVKYRAGHEVYCELSWVFREPEPSNWREFGGFFNTNDKWCVGYENDQFGVLFTEGGNDTFIPLGSNTQYGTTIDPLDGTGPSGYVLNPQAINVFRLAYVWHGGLALTLELAIGQQLWPVFVLDFANDITETHLENPHLPIGGFIERTAGTGSDAAGKTGSWRGGAIASAVSELSDDWLSHTNLDQTLSATARTNIMTLVNPSTWQGKVNHIVYEIGEVAFRNDGNKTVAVYGTKGATLTGATAAAFINEASYALQFRDGGTITGGQRGPAVVLGPDDGDRLDERGKGVFIYPGEAFTIEVDPGGASITGTFSATARLIHGG